MPSERSQPANRCTTFGLGDDVQRLTAPGAIACLFRAQVAGLVQRVQRHDPGPARRRRGADSSRFWPAENTPTVPVQDFTRSFQDADAIPWDSLQNGCPEAFMPGWICHPEMHTTTYSPCRPSIQRVWGHDMSRGSAWGVLAPGVGDRQPAVAPKALGSDLRPGWVLPALVLRGVHLAHDVLDQFGIEPGGH